MDSQESLLVTEMQNLKVISGTEFFKQMGTSLNMSSAYHRQTDGQTEIVNMCLEAYLCSFVTDKQNKWLQWLHLVEWWIVVQFHIPHFH
jgi:hypothetical protein